MARRQSSEAYRGYRTAGIRLTEELLPELAANSTEHIEETLPGIHRFDKAHIVMLTEEGLIPREAGVAMLKQLRIMEADGIEEVRLGVGGGLHSGEQFLIRRLGEDVGGHANLARSSGDIAEVARRYALRERLLELTAAVNQFRSTLIRLAREHADTVMPSYTHAQQAQPTGLGHWFAMWALVFGRDVTRGMELYARLGNSPAGAAILTGSDFPISRHRTAELLGFTAPSPNTMDAILSHDAELETAAFLAIHAANLGRLGDDVLLWSSDEFAMIEVPDRFCSSSSIMMQKKNPESLERPKTLAAQALGAAVSAFMSEKGPTGFPQAERRVTQSGFWLLFKSATRCLNELDALIASMRVHADRMAWLAGAYWSQATDLAGSLVRECGVSWRTAHQIVGILVRLSHERGLTPADTTPELVDEASIDYLGRPLGLSPATLARVLDPAEFLRRRDLYGGPSPRALERELPLLEAALEEDARRVATERERLAASSRKLERAIDTLIGPAADGDG